MKPIGMAALLALVAPFAIVAQAPPKQAPKPQTAPAPPVARCKGPDGRACSSKQVQALSDAAFSGKRQHEALALFRNLTLVSSDGTLKCEQTDGTPCTTAQLDVIKEIAAGQQVFINYNSSKSNTGN